MPLGLVHLVGSHPHQVVEPQQCTRRPQGDAKHPPHAWVAFTGNLTGPLRGHLTYQGHEEYLALPGEAFDALHQGPGGAADLAGVAAEPPRQRSHDHVPLLKSFRCCLCIDSTWPWHLTGPPAHALFSGHNESVSFTFDMKVEELA